MSRKSSLEKIVPDPGSSFKLIRCNETSKTVNNYWHSHPEYELVYLSHGTGKRHVGNHVSQFTNGLLVLMGPHLPHFEFGTGVRQAHEQIVVQFSPDFLDQSFFRLPEMNVLQKLKQLSTQGVSFHEPIKEKVGEMMIEMTSLNGFSRLSILLDILIHLSSTEEYEILNSESVNTDKSVSENERISLLYEYIGNNYQKEITITEVANLLSLSVPYACRFIKSKTHRTLSEIVSQYRVSKACDLLTLPDQTISGISYQVGFNNLSHFNKRFKAITGTSPREYRASLKPLN